jgi:aldose 1-epimerase
MRFSISPARQQDLDLVKIIDGTNGTEIAILPGYGASLHAFCVAGADGMPFNVIDHYRDRAELERFLSHSFKSPKLSPFPCRIPDGKYRFNDKEYQFNRLFADGTAIHGLLYDRPFAITGQTADEAAGTLCLEYFYKKDDAGYPFDYSCQVKYSLRDAGNLEIITTVTNLDSATIPIADGWHPYFRLGGRIDDWQLQFHSEAILEFDQRLVPTGRLLQYGLFDNLRKIGDTFLDNCFVLKPGIVSPACEIYNPANRLRISFYPDASYPYLQLYTPPGRDSIAVENLSGAPDCFNNKMGLILLPPGHSQIFTVRYHVSVDEKN